MRGLLYPTGCALLLLLGAPGLSWGQGVPAPALPTPRVVALNSVAVAPQVVDSKSWLLLDPDLHTELEGAVHNLHNFKFDKADKQFRSLRRRYPQHRAYASKLAECLCGGCGRFTTSGSRQSFEKVLSQARKEG